MYRCKMCLILKFGMDPLHIMVVHKIIKIQISHILKIFYCVGNLKIVVIIVSAVKSFMKGVYYFKNSSYVLTDSCHGMSCIFLLP